MQLRVTPSRSPWVRLCTGLTVVGIVGLLFAGLGLSFPSPTSTSAAHLTAEVGPVGTVAPPPPRAGAPPRPTSAAIPVAWTALTNLSLPAPSPRWSVAFAADPLDGVDLLYGGYSWGPGATYVLDNATWTLADGVWHEVNTTTTPPPMIEAAMAYDPDLGAMVLVGGTGFSGERTSSAETWEYHAGVWTRLSGTRVGSPPAALGASMAYDPVDHALVRFGGYEYNTQGEVWVSNETWVFSNGTWANATGRTEPTGAIGSAMAYDPATRSLVLVGGVRWDVWWSIEEGSNSTWEWANGSWSNASVAAGPDGSVGADLVWDPSIGALVLTGGGTDWYGDAVYGSLRTSWEFGENAWSRADVSGGTPPAPALGTAADPTLGGLVSIAVGGVAPADVQTWEFSRSPALSIAASHPSIDVGVPDRFSNLLANHSIPTSTAWRFGDGSTSVEASPSHAYAAPGTYVVNATASELVGNQSAFDWATYSTRVVPDPVAAIQPVPATVDVFENTSFSVTARNGTAPFTVNWSFGDGTSASGAWTVVHRYAAAGSYLATARIVDAFDVASNRTVAVHVEPFPLVTVALAGPVVDLGQPVTVRTATWNGSAPFAYSYEGLPPGCASVDVANLTCVPADTGQYDVEATVVDGHGVHSTSALELLTVAPPLAGSLGSASSVIDLGMNLTVTATFASQGSGNVTVQLALGAPCALLARFAATCHPTSVGGFSLTATASDTAGAVVSLGPILVTVNPPVALAAVGPPTAVDRDTMFTLSLAEAGGTAPFAYTLSEVPGTCVHLNTTWFRCDPQLAGSYSFGASVTDALGATASAHLVVTVVDGPPGTVSAPPPGSAPPPPAINLVLWAVVAAAVVEIVLSVRHARRPRRGTRRAPTFRKGLWSVLGSAAPDDLEADGGLELGPDLASE